MDATKKRGRPRGRVVSEDLNQRYRELVVLDHLGVSAIRAALVKEFGDSETPPLRTLQRWVREDRRGDDRKPWRVSMTAPDDVPAVFASIQAAIDATGGRTRWVSAAEADWIVRISKLGAGEMKPFDVWAQARRSARADARDASDYAEDIRLGVVTALLDDPFGIGSAQTLEEWIERGPG